MIVMHRKKHKGFSLAEMMMQLVILTVVTVPLIMILNMQKSSITQDQQTTTEKIQAEQLFDRVSVRISDPIEAFNVGPYTSGNKRYYYSLACDPGILPSATTECPRTGLGVNEVKGPFFERTLTYLPDNSAMQVNVKLYRTQIPDATNNPVYYETSREYQLDIYRVDVGYNAHSTPGGGKPLSIDGAGNIWWPDRILPASPTPGQATYATWNQNSCSSGSYAQVPQLSSLDSPFSTVIDLTCTSGLNYTFKAMPDRYYDVNLYFVMPNSVGLGCVSGIPNSSCALADIVISSLNNTYGGATTLKRYNNFDINAATGMQVRSAGGSIDAPVGYVFHDTVRTSAGNAGNLSVLVRSSTAAGSGTRHAYLAGVEVIRRDDQ